MTRSEQQATLLTFISLVMIGIGWLLMPPVSIKSQQSADKAMTEALQLLAPAPPVPEDIPTPEAPTTPAPITPEPVIEAPTPIIQPMPKPKQIKPKPTQQTKKISVIAQQKTALSASTSMPEVSAPTNPPLAVVNHQQTEDAAKNYRALLISILAKYKDYPRLSRRLGEEGTVRIRFTVSSDGHVSEIELVNSSGFEGLDVATLAIFEQLNQQLPAFLEGMEKKPVTFELPVHYTLSTSE
jgi:protein TonB